MTNKKRAEILRTARIFNCWELCKGSAYVHVVNDPGRFAHGTFVTAPGHVINKREDGGKLAWYESAQSRQFYDLSDGETALEQAFAFAVKCTGVPREQWVFEPFGGRSTWVPKPVLDAAVEKALAQLAASG